MGSVERRERERQELQTQILDATRAILSERGYEGLTMRAVADRVEYSAAALYKHFADREELVRALCARDFYAFTQVLSSRPGASLQGDAEPMERLRQIAHAYAEFAIQHPEQYRVMFMSPLPVEQEQSMFGDPEQDSYAFVARAVELAQDAGHFPGLDKDLVTQTLWATMHGVLSIEIAHLCLKKKPIPFAPLAARVETAMEGILLGLQALSSEQRSGKAVKKPVAAAKGAKAAKVPPSRARVAPRARAVAKRA